jgi:homoserine kinase
MIKISIPATSANLGPGFDCLGVALNMNNIIEVEEIESGLIIQNADINSKIPVNENNLVYRTMKSVFDRVGYNLKGLRIVQTNNIPTARGLGSSAACIVGGICAANEISGANLSQYDMALLAAQLDGHPDNTTPAMFGGMIISILDKDRLHYVKIDIPQELKFAAMIPKFTLSTSKSRMMLPKKIWHKDAAFNIGRASMLVASMLTGNTKDLSFMFEDKLHQPYRKSLIPDMNRIFQKSLDYGAKGCYLSGAGSTLMAVLDQNEQEFCAKMDAYISSLKYGWKVKLLEVNKTGAEIFRS